jgi:hypothetical protein
MIQLAAVLNDVCHSLEKRAGQPVSRDTKELLANRILAAFDAGITDPEVLRADALFVHRSTQRDASQPGEPT